MRKPFSFQNLYIVKQTLLTAIQKRLFFVQNFLIIWRKVWF